MKWFKHETDATQSEKLSSVRAEFGMAGLGQWWIIMEIVAGKMDQSDRHHVAYPVKKWGEILGFYHKRRLLIFLQSLSNVGLILVQCTSNPRPMYEQSSSNVLSISIPNLLKKRDYVKKKTTINRKKSPLEVEVEVEVEVEGELRPTYQDRGRLSLT